MSKKVRVGIVSFDHVQAPSYADVLKSIEEADLVGIYDSNEYRGTMAAREKDVKYFSELKELLRETDGAIITAENGLHLDLVLMAASLDTHVLCENPISTSIDEADAMINSCRENGVGLYTAFPMRYSPPVKELKELAERGDLGGINAISSTNHGKLPPGWFGRPEKSGGGSLIDQLVHLVGLFKWMFGLKAESVYAEAGTLLHDIPVEDCGIVTVEFSDESFATVDASWSRPETFPTWGDLNMRVYGDGGIVELKAFNQKIRICSESKEISVWDNWGTNIYREMVKDFVREISVGKNATDLASGEDGKEALRVALGSYLSLEERRVVMLDSA